MNELVEVLLGVEIGGIGKRVAIHCVGGENGHVVIAVRGHQTDGLVGLPVLAAFVLVKTAEHGAATHVVAVKNVHRVAEIAAVGFVHHDGTEAVLRTVGKMLQIVLVVLALNHRIVYHAVVQPNPADDVRHGLTQLGKILFGDGLLGLFGLHVQIRGRKRGLRHPLCVCGGRRGRGARQDGRQRGKADLSAVV